MQASPATETFTTRDFTVRASAGACTIEKRTQSRVFAPPPNAPTAATYACAGLRRDPNGTLLFQARGTDGEIVVAPPKV
ncbi:MAG: hypothetical protein ACYDAR_21570 [Thermomicrobiales bacterium]